MKQYVKSDSIYDDYDEVEIDRSIDDDIVLVDKYGDILFDLVPDGQGYFKVKDEDRMDLIRYFNKLDIGDEFKVIMV